MFAKCIDQTGHEVCLLNPPMRIISLVPSLSEYLWDLGLQGQLVGVTKFCIHPKELLETVSRVGGTKQLNLEKIKALRPDLIVANKEENDRTQIEYLQKEFSVYVSDVVTIEHSLAMMLDIAELTGTLAKARWMIEQICQRLESVNNKAAGKKIAYFIWQEPYMLAGGQTFINSLLTHCGFNNVVAHLERYPEMKLETLLALGVETLFLASEPFPFSDKHVLALKTVLQQQQLSHPVGVKLVDGEAFSWYGSRLLRFDTYVKQLLNDF